MTTRIVLSLFLLCSSLLSESPNSRELGFPFIRNYLPKEYENTPQVWGAIRDTNGVMYFGMTAGGGIGEYDGKTWRAIDVPNNPTVFSFAKNSRQQIYVGVINDFGVLTSNNRGKREFSSLRYLLTDRDLKFRAVWITAAVGDEIYFMCVDYIFKYSDKTKPSIKTFAAAGGSKFSGLFIHNGVAYVHQSKHGLMRIGSDSLETENDFYQDKIFRTGLSISADSIIIPTRNKGLFLYRPSTHASTPVALEPGDTAALNTIYSATLLNNKSIALASIASGVYVISLQGKTLQRWNEQSTLPENTVYSVYQDPDDQFWFMSSNGISRAESSPAWSYWGKQNGLKGTVVSILRYRNRIYCATMDGIFFINEKSEIVKVSGIPDGQNWSLLDFTSPEKKSMLLAGTPQGLFEILGDRSRLIRKGSYVLTMLASWKHPGRLFVVDDPSLASIRFENGTWKDDGIIRGVQENIRGIAEDANGEVWLGTFNAGVIRVTIDDRNIQTPKAVRYYTEKDGLPSLRSVLPFMINNELIFGSEHGLYKYNHTIDRFEPYAEIDSQIAGGGKNIYKMSETPSGDIVVLPSGNKKQDAGYLHRFDDGHTEWIYAPFRLLPQTSMDAVFSDSNGVLWIGGSEGLFRYDSRQDKKAYDRAFYAVIRKVTITGDSIISFGERSEYRAISFDHNDVRFEFAAPFFDDESRTTLSYQLAGYDKEWSPWSSNAAAVYTNLNEGTYTFRAKGKNLYGTESLTAEFVVTILPPWYRTWWAYGSVILLIGISIGFFDRWNKARLKRKYDEEHRQEQERRQNFSRMLMEKQEEERQRVAGELHDSLGQELLILKNNIQFNMRQEHLPEQIRAKFEEHSAAASEILAQMRIISHNLRPPELDKLGLTESIKAILRRVRNSVRLEIIGEIDEVDGFFAKNEEINFIRILQEALNNIMKHSGASRVTVIVRRNGDQLLSSVSDNGKGFTPESIEVSGLGMHDIEDRVRILGGKMSIESSPGEGTQLTFRFERRNENA